MGYKAMWAARAIIKSRDDLDTKEAFTLLAIAEYADDKGVSFPRRKNLMALTKLCSRATSAAIAGLVEKKLITSEERKDNEGQKSNLYTLCFSLNVEDHPIAPDAIPSSYPLHDMQYPLAQDSMGASTTCQRNLLMNQSENQLNINYPLIPKRDEGKNATSKTKQKEEDKQFAEQVINDYNDVFYGALPPAKYDCSLGRKIIKFRDKYIDSKTAATFRNYFDCFKRCATGYYFGNNPDEWMANLDYLLKPGTLRLVRGWGWMEGRN
ncbi:hypothetical protein QDF31_000488 [Escherichia coli]|nr:hypothetical protein [Escherichia coli]